MKNILLCLALFICSSCNKNDDNQIIPKGNCLNMEIDGDYFEFENISKQFVDPFNSDEKTIWIEGAIGTFNSPGFQKFRFGIHDISLGPHPITYGLETEVTILYTFESSNSNLFIGVSGELTIENINFNAGKVKGVFKFEAINSLLDTVSVENGFFDISL